MGTNEERALSNELSELLGESDEEQKERSETEETAGEETSDSEASEETEEEESEAGEDAEEDGEVEDEAAEEAEEETAEADDTKTDGSEAEQPQWENLSSDLVEQNKQLQALVKRLTEQDQQKEEQQKEAPKPFTEEQVFTDMVDELGLDKEGAGKFKTFVEGLVKQTQDSAVEAALRATPDTVRSTMETQNSLKEIREKFYADHPMLESVKGFMSQIASQVSTNNPDFSVEKVLEVSAKQAYDSMGLTEADVKKHKDKLNAAKKGSEAGKRKKPAFAKTSGTRKKAPEQTPFDKEADAMLALDE